MAEGDNPPGQESFTILPGFGPRDSSEQEQIPFPLLLPCRNKVQEAVMMMIEEEVEG